MKTLTLVSILFMANTGPVSNSSWRCEFNQRVLCDEVSNCQSVKSEEFVQFIPTYSNEYRQCLGNRCVATTALTVNKPNETLISVAETGNVLRVDSGLNATEVSFFEEKILISRGKCENSPLPPPLLRLAPR